MRIIKLFKKLFKKIFHRHSWIYGYTYNPDGTTKVDKPLTWHGPVVRKCEICGKEQIDW